VKETDISTFGISIVLLVLTNYNYYYGCPLLLFAPRSTDPNQQKEQALDNKSPETQEYLQLNQQIPKFETSFLLFWPALDLLLCPPFVRSKLHTVHPTSATF